MSQTTNKRYDATGIIENLTEANKLIGEILFTGYECDTVAIAKLTEEFAG